MQAIRRTSIFERSPNRSWKQIAFFWDDFVTENAYSVEASFGMVYSRFAKEGPFSNRTFRFRLHAPQTARPMATAHRDLARVGLARTAQAVFNLAI